jgi:ribosome maturation factor RimP
MDKDLIPKLWGLIEPIVEPENMELVELEFKPEGRRWVLRVYIDSEEGVTLDDCAMVSRQVSALMDMEDPIRQPYLLEVSSPGINRVLRKEQDFKRFAGSPVQLKARRKINGRRNFQGILKGMENSKIVVEVDGKPMEIPPDAVERARLDLPETELFRRDPHKGLATSGD